MNLKEFFSKLMHVQEVKEADPYYNGIVDARDYAAFRTLEAIVMNDVHEHMRESNPKFYKEFKPQLRSFGQLVIGGTILAMATIKAQQYMRSSMIARHSPEDIVIWQQVQLILLSELFSHMLTDDMHEAKTEV